MGHGFVDVGVASGRGGGCGMWGRGEESNVGLDLSLLGQETLQSFFIGQRVVEPWVGHVGRLSLHALGRVERWFGRGLERCNGSTASRGQQWVRLTPKSSFQTRRLK